MLLKMHPLLLLVVALKAFQLNAEDVAVEQLAVKLSNFEPFFLALKKKDTSRENLDTKLKEFRNEILEEVKSGLKSASEERNQIIKKEVEERNASMEKIDKKLNEFSVSILEIKTDVKSASEERNQSKTHLTSLSEKLEKVHKNVSCLLWRENLKENGTLKKLETGTYFYSYPEIQKTWNEAKEYCESQGLKLAEIQSEKEMKIIEGAAPKKDAGYWIGANDIGQTPGNFVWNDGRSVQKSWFHSRQPDDFGTGKETCLWLYSSYGNLVDESCKIARYFICKIEYAACV